MSRMDGHWLTIDEAARYLRVSVGTVRNWISAGRIPCVKRGRVVRLNKRELDDWLRGTARPRHPQKRALEE